MILLPIHIKKSGGYVKEDMNGKVQFLIEQTGVVVHIAAGNWLLRKIFWQRKIQIWQRNGIQ
jgi:hypothetical protein